MNSLISVIIPVYNTESYLKRCIDSVLNQTFQNFEIILVDDGSSDNCPGICDDYASKDNRIVVIHENHGGVSLARNAGLNYVLSNSNTQYISFIDSDDYVDKSYFETLLFAIVNKKCDVVSCSHVYVKNDNPGVNTKTTCDAVKTYNRYQALLCLYQNNNIEVSGYVWAKLYKKSIWENIRFPEDILVFEDIFVMNEILLNCINYVFIPYCGYFYTQINPSSLTKSKDNNLKIISCWSVLKTIVDQDFSSLCENQIQQLKKTASILFLKYYFDSIPKFDISQNHILFNDYVRFVRKQKLLKYYKPSNIKEWLIKYSYIFSPRIHRILRRLRLIIKGVSW